MSTATPTQSTQTPANKDIGPLMFGRDIFVEALEREGCEVIFAYPGGASMEIHQSLTKSKIRTILPRHEQGAASPPRAMRVPPARPACAWRPAVQARPTS